MKQPENIRNIAICAHIDHGKCVSGDTKVFLNNGKLVSAKDLFDRYENKGKVVKDFIEKVVDVKDFNVETISFNKVTNKLEKKKIDFMWRIKTDEKLLKVRCLDNKEISVTPEHKFLVSDKNYKVVEKRGSDLREGDYIISPRSLDYEPITTDELESTLLHELSKDIGFIAKVNENFKEFLHEKIIKNDRKKIWEIVKSPLKFLSFYHCAWKGRYRLIDLVNLAKIFKISDFELYQNIEFLNYRASLRKEFKNSIYIKLPKTHNQWRDFFYLLGLMWGDGDVNFWISTTDELIKKEVKRICSSIFGVEPQIRIYENKCPRIDLKAGLTFKKILTTLFDFPTKRKSHKIKMPSLIQSLPKDILSEFLKGYFDTDGYCSGGKHYNEISISSASEMMIKDLQLSLLKFGCLSKIYKKDAKLKDKLFPSWHLTISGFYSLSNFKDKIDFKLEYKKENLEKSVNRSELNINTDYLPFELNSVRSGKRGVSLYQLENLKIEGLLSEIAKKNLFLNKIKEIKEIENVDGIVYDFTVSDNHNFIAEGMIVHNTTFSDNLIAGAGMMSEELAGKQLVLDFHEDEQERGITIDAANVSMVHDYEGKEYLINLIDTPGHVDFGGDVTRAMRAVDGCIVLVDAVEGIMPQTETVLRQALKERVKPTLFINKVDRLIKEVKLTPEQMQERFIKIINDINKLITSIAPEEFKSAWHVSVKDSSVSFGSAFHKWALNFEFMKKTNISFKNIIEHYQEGEKYKGLGKEAPLHLVVLSMVIKHLPNPIVAQKYRIPTIWRGDKESEEGKALINCDPNGPVAFICTKIVIDKHAGEVAAGRLFSGTMKQGQDIYMNQAKKDVRLQQVSVYNGAKRETIDSVPAGNIIGLTGLRGIFTGETVSSKPIEPFEEIKHIFEPVITMSIEAKKPSDLPRLVEILKQVNKEDPTITIQINEETGENLLSGMGELHLEVKINRIKTEKGLDVISSPPIVVYRETIKKKSIEVEGKSPNKHNKFYLTVEPLPDNIYEAIKSGELKTGRVRKKDREIWDKFVGLGLDAKEARKVTDIFKGNLFIDNTRGVIHIGEVMEMLLDAFEEIMSNGPLAKEPCVKVLVRLNDCKLHEDAIHRGPAQVLPAVRDAIREAMINSNAIMFEPLQIVQIEAPLEYMGELSKLAQNKRGQLLDMTQEGEHLTLKAKLPVAEMFGLASDLRSATGGRGNYYIVDQVFEKLPEDLQARIIKQIRQRKGLKIEE
ncbi:MAG TPA: elongation factor EF-2 [Candidatus Nanoarchaeia archaeon]|nr:elongation factor EF-2 [Candidatus Nanoarchaeia archaeon]